MLSIKDLTVCYQSKAIIKDLNLEVGFPSIVAVIGNNGVGKSSFLNALRNQVPFEGNIFVKGERIDPRYVSNCFSFLGQSYHFQFPFLVEEFIRINHAGVTYDEKYTAIVSSLKIEEFVGRKIETLSQGQLQKCLIAQTLMQESEVILLDEPESFLDLKNRAILGEALLKYKESTSKIIFIVTHDLQLVGQVADKIINFSASKIVLEDSSLETIAKHRAILLA